MASPDGTTLPVKCLPPVQIGETAPVHSTCTPACVENGGGSTHFFIDASTLLDDGEVGMPSPRLPPAEQVTASFHKELSFDEPTRPKPVPRQLSANAGAHVERQPITARLGAGSEGRQPITLKDNVDLEENLTVTDENDEISVSRRPIPDKNGDIEENSRPIAEQNADFVEEKQPITRTEISTEIQPITRTEISTEIQPIGSQDNEADSLPSQEIFDDLDSNLATLHLNDTDIETNSFTPAEQALERDTSHNSIESTPKLETSLPSQGLVVDPPIAAQETAPTTSHRHPDINLTNERRIPPQPTPRTRLPSSSNQTPAVPASEPITTETTPSLRLTSETSTNHTPAPVFSTNQTAAPVFSTNQTATPVFSTNQAAPPMFSTNQTAAPVFSTNQTATPVFSTNQAAPPVFSTNQAAAPVFSTNQTALGRAQADILSELAALLTVTERKTDHVVATETADFPVATEASEQWQPGSWSEEPACPPASLQPVMQADMLDVDVSADIVHPFPEIRAARVSPFDETNAAHVTSTPPGSPSPFQRHSMAPPLSLTTADPKAGLSLALGPKADSSLALGLETDSSLVDSNASNSLSLDGVDSSARSFVLHDAASQSEEERRQGNAIFQTRSISLPDGGPPDTGSTESVPVEVAPPPPAKRPCGFFVDLAELPSPEAPPPPPVRADAGHALFSMFIDFAPPTKTRANRPLRPGGATTRDEPMGSKTKPIASQLGKNKPMGSQPDVSQPIETQICKNNQLGNHSESNQPMESHHGKNKPVSQSEINQPMGTQVGSSQPTRREYGVNESDESKARRPRLPCISDSDSPLPRRRSSTSSRQPSQRHSWNPDALSSTTTSTRKHRRASSLSHSLTEDTSSSLSTTVELGSATLGTVDVSTSRTFSVSGSKGGGGGGGKSEVSIVSDTISEGRMITEEEAQDLTDVDEIAPDVVASTNETAAFVKLSDMDTASPVPAATHAPRMTQSIPEGAWPSTVKPGMSRSVQGGGCSRSLGRLFPHLMTSSAEESELSDVSLPSSMQTSAMEASTEESGGSPATRLGEDLLRMFLEEISPDVTLDVGGRRIRAHKCILASRCQYFAAVLSGGWVTSAGDLISLQGFSYNAVFFALCHIYSGTGDVPDSISLVELATLADMLALEGLKEVVSMALRAKFCHFFHKPCAVCSVGVVECLPLAAAYGLDDIYRRALRWIARHFVRIWPTKGFAALPRELVEKCYQQIVVHMSAESVLETVLGADKLLATLPSARWAEPVFALASQLLDSAVRFAAHHLGHVLNTPSFQSLGGEQSWNIGRLEESLVRAADRMPPEQACLSVARLDSWLNDSPTVLRSAAYAELLRRLSLRAEARLVACGARSVRAASWQRVPVHVRERVAAASNIDLEAAAAAAELAAAQRRPQVAHRSLTGSRHLDLRQVKLAMTQQARRAASGGRVSALTNDSRPRRQPVAVIHPRQVTEPRPIAAESRPLATEPRPRPPLVEVRPPVEASVVVETRPAVEPAVVVETRAATESRPVATETRPAIESRVRETRVNGDVRGRRKLISSSDSSRAGSPALHRPARATATTAALPAASRLSEPRPSELDMSTDSLSSPRTTGAAHSPHSPLLPPSRRPRAPLISPRESHTSRLRSAAAAAKAAAPAKATPVRAAPAKATPSKATPLRSANKTVPLKATPPRDTPTPARANRVAPLKGAAAKRAANPVKATAQALGSRSGTFLKDEPSVLRKPSGN